MLTKHLRPEWVDSEVVLLLDSIAAVADSATPV